jgi:uncharacterized tellurite resistance protein B-like protein
MSYSDFITNSGRRICIDYYIHLVQASRIDGKISKEELDMLHRKGKYFGLTDPEIDKIINSEKDHHYTPRYSLQGKFDDLYSISQIIMADGHMSEAERKLLKKMSIESGFEDSKLDGIVEILVNGFKENIDDEVLFNKFRKHILS